MQGWDGKKGDGREGNNGTEGEEASARYARITYEFFFCRPLDFRATRVLTRAPAARRVSTNFLNDDNDTTSTIISIPVAYALLRALQPIVA